MKVSFTIGKRVIDKEKLVGVKTDEVTIENVKDFQFDEAIQKIYLNLNDGSIETIELFTEGKKFEQWYLCDIKCVQAPLIIE